MPYTEEENIEQFEYFNEYYEPYLEDQIDMYILVTI